MSKPSKEKTQPRRRKFSFAAQLETRMRGGTRFILQVPRSVSEAIGRRGPVPVVVTLNRLVEVQLSMVPMGGGRHWLQLNGRTRAELEIEPGDTVRVVLIVPEKVPILRMPAELAKALDEANLRSVFESFPPGKQNHIINWIDLSARPETREKRVRVTVQAAFMTRERAHDRQAARRKGAPSQQKS